MSQVDVEVGMEVDPYLVPKEELVDLEVPKTKFNDFGITGDALQTLKSAYKTVTGRAPTGTLNPETGRYEDIDVRLLADQLVGAKAWNVIIHREGKDANAGELFANLGYTFKRQPPAKYVVKKPSKKEE